MGIVDVLIMLIKPSPQLYKYSEMIEVETICNASIYTLQ